MRAFSVFGVAFWGIVGLLVLTAVLTATFIRETTGIEERWGNRTLEERQTDLINPILDLTNDPNYQSNVSTRTSPRPTGSEDHDNDGLSNDVEIALGIDPANPDTDGDGVLDGIEKERGTNPNDPEEGGLAPVPPATSTTAVNRLIITQLSKTALVDGKPVHFVTLPVESTIQFRIRMEAENLGGSHTLIIEDKLPNSFRDFTGTIQVNGSASTKLTAGLLNHYVLNISPTDRLIIVEINFSVTATAVGSWENVAAAYEPNRLNGLSDKVYVRVTPPGSSSSSDQLSANCTICNIFVLGRSAADKAWSTQVFAETGSQIDFYISVETANLEGGTQTFSVSDTLPTRMKYIAGSGKLFYDGRSTPKNLTDDWLTGLELKTTRTTNRFEIYFSAKVESEEPFSLTNATKAVSWDNSSYTAVVKINSN